MGHDFAGMARQINQQIKFLGREMHFLTTDRDFVGRQVDPEITDLDQRRLLAFSSRSAAQIRAYTRQQFLDPERLGNIVPTHPYWAWKGR